METYNFDSFSSGADSFGSEDTSADSGSETSNDIGKLLEGSPFGRLQEVLGEDGLSTIFSGVGGDSSGSSPFGGDGGSSAMSGDLAYGGNPFAGDNFWNIFAGGVKPG